MCWMNKWVSEWVNTMSLKCMCHLNQQFYSYYFLVQEDNCSYAQRNVYWSIFIKNGKLELIIGSWILHCGTAILQNTMQLLRGFGFTCNDMKSWSQCMVEWKKLQKVNIVHLLPAGLLVILFSSLMLLCIF